MSRKSVAVLDIRSSSVTIIVGERGVNHTFVVKAKSVQPYSGYMDGEVLDQDEFSEAIYRAVTETELVCNENIRCLYVGIPGEFIRTVLKLQKLSFSRRKKITPKDITELYRKGEEKIEGCRHIRTACALFSTSDDRQIVDPIGVESVSLEGVLTYFYCVEPFAKLVGDIFAGMKISVRFLPTELAMSNYLISSETRDEYALFLDAGFLSSTIAIVRGNGMIVEKTFGVGKGHIIFHLMEKLSLPYDVAEAFLDKVNLCSGPGLASLSVASDDSAYEIKYDKLLEATKEGIDQICECVTGFLDEYAARELDFKPLFVSGDGPCEIRGALEHMSKRINRICELLSPDIPYYNKPSMSSYIALLDMACGDSEGTGFFKKIFKGLGG